MMEGTDNRWMEGGEVKDDGKRKKGGRVEVWKSKWKKDENLERLKEERKDGGPAEGLWDGRRSPTGGMGELGERWEEGREKKKKN